MSAIVNSKGQVTLPKAVRDRLKVKPGSVVDFKLADDGRVVLVKAGRKPTAPRKSRFDRLRGIMKSDMTTDEIMASMRGAPAEV